MKKILFFAIFVVITTCFSASGQKDKLAPASPIAVTAPAKSNPSDLDDNDGIKPKKFRLFGKSLDEENYPFTLGIIYGSEGPGISLTQSFPIPIYVDFIITKKSQLGIAVGYKPLEIANNVLISTALQWQYRLNISIRDNNLVENTFNSSSRQIGTFKMGVSYEPLWRMVLGIYWNTGISWLSGKNRLYNYTTNKGFTSDTRWYQGVSVVLGLKL
jgi:hypothetical protein